MLLQKLMQAVEEARGLLLEGSLAYNSKAWQKEPQHNLLAYPAPTREDCERKTGKQLRRFLQAAAVEPEVSMGFADYICMTTTANTIPGNLSRQVCADNCNHIAQNVTIVHSSSSVSKSLQYRTQSHSAL